MELKTLKDKNQTDSRDTNRRQSVKKRRFTHFKVSDPVKEVSYSRVISNYRLSDWIHKYGVHVYGLKSKDRDTFIDAAGKERYVDNWQRVNRELEITQEDIESNEYESFFFRTGCMKLSYIWHYHFSQTEAASDGNNSRSEESRRDESAKTLLPIIPDKVCQSGYIHEWQRVWVYLENDEFDILLKHAPLFRLVIECLFHPRMQKLMAILGIYNVIVQLLLILLFPHALRAISIVYIYANIFAQVGMYFAIVLVYRGEIVSLFGSPSPPKSKSALAAMDFELPTNRKDHQSINMHHPDFIRNVQQTELPVINETTDLRTHFQLIRKELFTQINDEFHILFPWFLSCVRCCSDRQRVEQWKVYRSQRRQLLDKYYLQRKKTLSYHDLLNISLKFLTKINGVNPDKITFDRWSYRALLIFITVFFPFYLFGYQYLSYFVYLFVTKCDSLEQMRDQEICAYNFGLVIGTLGLTTQYLLQLVFAMSIMTALASLSYGAEIAYRLIDVWIMKLKHLRRVEEFDMVDFLTNSSQLLRQHVDSNVDAGSSKTVMSNQDGEVKSILHTSPEEKQKQNSSGKHSPIIRSTSEGKSFLTHFEYEEETIADHPLFEWITRDATEHYLFICEVLSASDRLWSSALTGIFLVGFTINFIGGLYAYLYSNQQSVYTFVEFGCFLTIRVLVLLIYPVMSLCHANSYMYELVNCFKQSSKDDYQLIGGRERWIELMTNCPAAWTFHGIWITWERLFGVLYAIAAAGVVSGAGALAAKSF